MKRNLILFVIIFFTFTSCDKKVVYSTPPGTNGLVIAMVVYNGKLIAGGEFNAVGNVGCNRIAQWDGKTWSSIGYPGNDTIVALTTWNGNLITGGSSGNICEWNGTSWTTLLTETIKHNIFTMISYNGNLYAGGNINDRAFIEQWDGNNWSSFGNLPNNYSANINEMINYNGNMVVCGFLDSIGGIMVSGIAEWNGSTWSPLGTGIDPGNPALVYSECIYNGNLIVGGAWGSQPFSYTLAEWNGSTWEEIQNPCPVNSAINDLATYNGNIVTINNNLIEEMNGTNWNSLGSTYAYLDNTYFSSYVNVSLVYNGNLIIGGSFSSVNGVPAYFIAQWNGSTWSAVQ